MPYNVSPGLLVLACHIICAVLKINSRGYYAATHPIQHITDGFGEHVYGQTCTCYGQNSNPAKISRLLLSSCRDTSESTKQLAAAHPDHFTHAQTVHPNWLMQTHRAADAAASSGRSSPGRHRRSRVSPDHLRLAGPGWSGAAGSLAACAGVRRCDPAPAGKDAAQGGCRRRRGHACCRRQGGSQVSLVAQGCHARMLLPGDSLPHSNNSTFGNFRRRSNALSDRRRHAYERQSGQAASTAATVESTQLLQEGGVRPGPTRTASCCQAAF